MFAGITCERTKYGQFSRDSFARKSSVHTESVPGTGNRDVCTSNNQDCHWDWFPGWNFRATWLISLPAEGPVVTFAKADHSLIVATEKGKPQVAGKEKDGPLWFTSMAGLVMTRDRSNNVELSGSTVPFSDPLLMTRDAAMDWGGGFDIRFGRFFNNRQQAWEVVYWGLFADAEVADVTDPDGAGTTAALNTPFQFHFTFL